MPGIIDADHYDRQKRVSGWNQDVVSASKCLVVGAGALGNEVVKSLCQLGVGQVGVLDYDSIVPANLNRCVFFTREDARQQRLKAEVLAERAEALNPDCNVTPIVKRVEDVPEKFFSKTGFTAVFSCLDNLGARLHVNAHCYGNVPLVDGGTSGFSGKVQVVQSPGACLECSLSKRDYALLWKKYSCTGTELELVDPKMPALPTTTSVIAGIQVNEFVKIAHAAAGKAQQVRVNVLTRRVAAPVPEKKFAFPHASLEGKYLFYNGLTASFSVLEARKRPACPVHPA